MSLRVTQTRSSIGTKPKQRGTLRALGLRRLGQSNDLPDRPEIRGMLAKVPHLVTVEEIDGAEATAEAVTANEISAEQPEAAPAAEAVIANESVEEEE